MIIYYTRAFKEAVSDPTRLLKISEFRLGLLDHAITKDQIEIDYSTSPGKDDYYELTGFIGGDRELTLKIEVPESDASVEVYKAIYVYYNEEDRRELGFILFGGIQEKDGILEVSYLNLEPQNTIVTVPNFPGVASIEWNQSKDIKFLEGPGIGNIVSLFGNSKEGYVSRVSYEAYLQEKRGTDDYTHAYTTFINKYGLKVY